MPQVKEVEAAAERAAAQSAAIIEEAMAQAEETRRRAEQDTQSQVSVLPGHEHSEIDKLDSIFACRVGIINTYKDPFIELDIGCLTCFADRSDVFEK